ncbi:AEC family transporter [Aliivibrio sp. S4TY2]|uniref:AEC family transporter n=1 Tax=unclassified Aliivibrio TaxID=2645654 RepID=UPI002378CB17|nr:MULTISPECIES: AEC family transporter [unclassified Aliivibrio]MDD9155138.1 AEC family transporter [Aliivibrio sp. S4TY2]MDD9159310.1 AEC family transporter [Aliivibrio sp. S4TY1]MDD9163140.1 AEC family transporter [Aliivibrio sp. S4MY2]MDD9167309.1 AEC family transporter [Aliivibrio sp. S4MY4]MDD9184217.1 AEC family transporter [Aliivibrio sp. S4MY3]
MDNFITQLLFSASITGPICLMLFLGVLLKRTHLINDNFIEVSSKLVFQVTLPAMLFLSIVNANHDFASSSHLIIYGLVANFLFFIFTIYSTRFTFKNKQDHGVIIQGGFRSNTAIIALAYVANAYGNAGVALAAIYVAATTILYNIQAVIALTPKDDNDKQAFGVIVKTLTKNPLIISIILGIACSSLSVPIPKIITQAGQYFANMTLPLALLCAGGSLNLTSMKKDNLATWFATSYKLILSPVFITIGGILLGFRGLDLGLLFFMSAAPTAAASYVMARAMGGNATLAANIIAQTTVASLVTCTLGIFILSSFGLI